VNGLQGVRDFNRGSLVVDTLELFHLNRAYITNARRYFCRSRRQGLINVSIASALAFKRSKTRRTVEEESEVRPY
jgi:hypothetical protein